MRGYNNTEIILSVIGTKWPLWERKGTVDLFFLYHTHASAGSLCMGHFVCLNFPVIILLRDNKKSKVVWRWRRSWQWSVILLTMAIVFAFLETLLLTNNASSRKPLRLVSWVFIHISLGQANISIKHSIEC